MFKYVENFNKKTDFSDSALLTGVCNRILAAFRANVHPVGEIFFYEFPRWAGADSEDDDNLREQYGFTAIRFRSTVSHSENLFYWFFFF